jgi:hypothetical protein
MFIGDDENKNSLISVPAMSNLDVWQTLVERN